MTTEERLEKLEAELAETKVALAAWTTQKIIQANTFVVEYDQGKPRAGLGMTKDGPRLALCDENGVIWSAP
jgi:hypothetical protein